MTSITKLPINQLNGVGPKKLAKLQALQIHTVADILNLKPNRYENRSQLTHIADAPIGKLISVKGIVKSIRVIKGRNWKKRLEITIEDTTSSIKGVWFNQPYLKEQFKRGQTIIFSGKISNYKGLQISSPDFEIIDTEADNMPNRYASTGRVVAIYPLCQGLNQNFLRKLADQALTKFSTSIKTILTQDIHTPSSINNRLTAIENLHFPKTIDEAENARLYLAFEEFFLFQIAILTQKQKNKKQNSNAFICNQKIDARIKRLFTFSFTDAQNRVIEEIKQDMLKPKPMIRLVQGDVGSGKTAVAIYTMLVAVANKSQACIMAPTEILAKQHEQTIKTLLKHSSVKTVLIVGSLTTKEKTKALQQIASGEANIIIGTHALVQEKVTFDNLGLAVIDEQHKFGVLQRNTLVTKGKHTKLLLMSATPIPRSMALTIYGDLDISIIDQLPPGRKNIITKQIPKQSRHKAYQFIRTKLQEGQQAYCVYPLVEESEKLDLKSATEMANLFATEIFPEFTIALLHGKLDGATKNRIMQSFNDGKIQILVSTVVIEVGVNVPNANIMLIEEAQRFGLAQIHQLRGRIGRGSQEAHCLLMAGETSQSTRKRLAVLTSTNDGFKISEADLQIRGPGEFMGTKQHGIPTFNYGDVLSDFTLMSDARLQAQILLSADAELINYKKIKIASQKYQDLIIGA